MKQLLRQMHDTLRHRLSGYVARVLVCVLALATIIGSNALAAKSDTSEYGTALLETYVIPASMLKKYNAAAAKSQPGGDTFGVTDDDWHASPFDGVTDKPYTFVIKVTGPALADGA